eukprot:366107-Chlamydomonas_euryale.AAC.5
MPERVHACTYARVCVRHMLLICVHVYVAWEAWAWAWADACACVCGVGGMGGSLDVGSLGMGNRSWMASCSHPIPCVHNCTHGRSAIWRKTLVVQTFLSGCGRGGGRSYTYIYRTQPKKWDAEVRRVVPNQAF